MKSKKILKTLKKLNLKIIFKNKNKFKSKQQIADNVVDNSMLKELIYMKRFVKVFEKPKSQKDFINLLVKRSKNKWIKINKVNGDSNMMIFRILWNIIEKWRRSKGKVVI